MGDIGGKMDDERELPEVSVVVPVYNDPEGLQRTLTSLIAQRYDRYEILPVDNNSTDETSDVIASFASEHPDLIHPCEEVTFQSSYAARNSGIESGSGSVFLFLDADMWVEETWVENMVLALRSHDCDYVGCNVKVSTDSDHTVPVRYEKSLSFPVESYLRHKQFAPTCALAVQQEVFETVGLFDHRLVSGGDKEFGQRVYQAGFDQGYAAEVTAYHPARDSFEALFSKAKRLGRGRAQMRYYHPNAGNYPHPLHPINYLPPSPWRLRQRYSGGESVLSLIELYVLEYLLKLIQTSRFVHETTAIKRRSD